MKFSVASLVAFAATITSCSAFMVTPSHSHKNSMICHGYLDDLSKELYQEEDNPDSEATTSREATNLAEEKKDRFGVGDWSSFVDFDEFDGGDGQMGVAGDGNKGLEKIGADASPQMAKSKVMSAKNAWGKTTGYAQVLIDQGMESTRAQQLENWKNQQEVQSQRNAQRFMTDEFDQNTGEENQWDLSKFGVERNQEFDFDEAFGAATAGDIEGTIQLSSRIGQAAVHEFGIKNEYMGFADFRAAFTPETSSDWTVEPKEGSLSSRDLTNFIVRFRPQNPGTVEGYLIIETEDFKKTWKLIGGTA